MPVEGDTRTRWLDFLGHHALRALPVGAVSMVGAALGGRAARGHRRGGRQWPDRLRRNLERLGADAVDAPEVEIGRHIGRIYAEASVVPRLLRPGRLTTTGLEILERVPAPAVFVSVHTGNWELVPPVLFKRRERITALYDPPSSEMRHRLALASRRRGAGFNPGYTLVPASPAAPRELIRGLERGDDIVLYIDEYKHGVVWAPALGREIPVAGNRRMAARLARRFGAPVVPIHFSRTGNARYHATIGEPIPADADAIAEHFDPIIRSHLLEWYWMPDLDLDAPVEAPPREDGPPPS